MGTFEVPPSSAEEIEASRPLAIHPEEVLELDEREWLARVYRRDARQLTVRAIATGSVIGFVLAIGHVYVALKAGLSFQVNLAACTCSFALWSTLKKLGLTRTRMTILEDNCAQSTAASAAHATGNAVVAAFPALLMLTGKHLPWPLAALWVFLVALLGVFLAIPLKRTMINRERLRFPSGIAAAVTLQSLHSRTPEAAGRARALFTSAGLAAIVSVLTTLKLTTRTATPGGVREPATLLPDDSSVLDWLTKILPSSWAQRVTNAGGKTWLLGEHYQMKLLHSVLLAGAGALVGLRITAWMVAGGLTLALYITPLALSAPSWTDATGKVIAAVRDPMRASADLGLWYGAPMLVASGLVGFLARRRAFTEPARWIARVVGRAPAPPPREASSIEVPSSWFWSGFVIAGGALVVTARVAFGIPLALGVVALAMTFLLTVVVCRATGESEITPSGPAGKITQIANGFLMPQAITPSIMTASITANASTAAAELLTDLKSGYLLGADPRRQFVAQALGVISGTAATVLAFYILVPDVSVLVGDGSHKAIFNPIAARQWRTVAEVLAFGVDRLHPMARSALAWGAGLGTVLTIAERAVPPRLRRWVPSPLGLGFGLSLPFAMPFTMFLGALAGAIASRTAPRWSERYLVAVAAGGIAGESVIAVVIHALNTWVMPRLLS